MGRKQKQYLRDFMAIEGQIDNLRKVLSCPLDEDTTQGIYSAINVLCESGKITR